MTSFQKSRRRVISIISSPGPTVALSSNVEEEDSKIIIVAIAVGVTCVLMLLIMIAVVMARMNR
jgi:hypothetical protein